MNKKDLIDAIAKDADLTKDSASKALDAALAAIVKQLKKGSEVRLAGFGTFSISDRKAREGRNPSTGAKIKIPASKQPKFKPSKALKDAANAA